MSHLIHLTVRGFKSIRALEEFELRPLNVLIGPAGAGKSNFIDLFQMLRHVAEKRLQMFAALGNRPKTILHDGVNTTRQIEVQLTFGKNTYRFVLVPDGKRFVFKEEEIRTTGEGDTVAHSLGGGHDESRIEEIDGREDDGFSSYLRGAVAGWRSYHLNDTSGKSGMRGAGEIRDNLELRSDASNLVPFLRHLNEKYPSHYRQIVTMTRHVAPFLEDFIYREDTEEYVELEWLHAGNSKMTLGPQQLSDGTLRFIGLATALLQPDHFAPGLMLIDEPELSLHPRAVALVADMLKSASETRQIIVTTQSADLVSEMDPEDIVVVNRADGESLFDRLDRGDLQVYMEEDEHTLGDLWKMNTFGGCLSR